MVNVEHKTGWSTLLPIWLLCLAIHAFTFLRAHDLYYLNPCWLSGSNLLTSRNLVIWLQTTFSITFEAATKQLTCLKLFSSVLSPFFNMGTTMASFQWSGTTPLIIEALMMWVKGSAMMFDPKSRQSWVTPSEPALFFVFHFFHYLSHCFDWDSFEAEVKIFVFNLLFQTNQGIILDWVIYFFFEIFNFWNKKVVKRLFPSHLLFPLHLQ